MKDSELWEEYLIGGQELIEWCRGRRRCCRFGLYVLLVLEKGVEGERAGLWEVFCWLLGTRSWNKGSIHRRTGLRLRFVRFLRDVWFQWFAELGYRWLSCRHHHFFWWFWRGRGTWGWLLYWLSFLSYWCTVCMLWCVRCLLMLDWSAVFVVLLYRWGWQIIEGWWFLLWRRGVYRFGVVYRRRVIWFTWYYYTSIIDVLW